METLFGRSYETIGNVNSDLLLKSKGMVKVQIGNQFLDLLNGSEKSQDNYSLTQFIKKLSSQPTGSSHPNQDGIYVYNNEIYLVINNILYRISANVVQ